MRKSRSIKPKLNLENYTFGMNALTYVISLLFMFTIYNYLAKLDTCTCVNETYVNEVKKYEVRLIWLLFISIILTILVTITISQKHPISPSILIVVAVIYLMVFLYYAFHFVSSTHKLKKEMKRSCKCAMRWQRWLLYTQYYAIIIDVFFVILAMVLGVVALAKKNLA